jgi:glycosyltransferase involved in cell wall biosynthesis
MNLFIIPSWYPSPDFPLAGIFTQEQAEAIADLAPDIQVLVSTWGHDRCEMSLRDLKKNFAAWNWYRRNRKGANIVCKNGVYEIFNASLGWPERLRSSRIKRLVAVNRKNLTMAIKRFGNVDLLHAHVSYPAGYIAYLLSHEFEIPYVLTEHMSPFPFPSLMQQGKPRREIYLAFESAAASIAVSPALADRITSFGIARPVVIPNIVDERRFQPGTTTAKKIVFFTLAGLTAQKGIDHLLQSIAYWNPPVETFEFRIGGTGPQRAEYEELAETLQISDRVRWLGSVSRAEAPRLFQECQIYVMPSRHETFGVVFAEAIACGKPVIATRCGGPEWIVNETNGTLVEIGDIAGLAAAMQEMVSKLDSYDSGNIRADFVNRFSRHAVVPQLLGIYHQLSASAERVGSENALEAEKWIGNVQQKNPPSLD